MSITLNTSNTLRRTRRVTGVVAAPVAAFMVWLAAGPLAGIDLTVRTGGGIQDVAPVDVVLAALAAGLAAWALRVALDRVSGGGRTAWTAIAVVVLLASLLLGPLGGTTVAATIVLVTMHVVVAAALIPTMAPPADRG